jgi:predicted amidophosphoribosyltransferase
LPAGDLLALRVCAAGSEPLCPQCGLPARSDALPCGRCLQKPPPWQRLVAVNDYRPPLSGLIHQLEIY